MIDETTFADIWRTHAPDITRWLRARVADLAEDLCQDVFLKAWRIRAQYDPARGPVIGWLYTIAGSVVADHLRATSRRPSTVDYPDGYEVRDVADVATQVCDQVDATAALVRVPARDRELLARRYLADQPVAQVAADLDMAVGTVKSRCHKALAALRTALGVVAPTAPRTPDPTPEPAPATIPAARSTTVVDPHPRPDLGARRRRGHRPDPRRPRPAALAGGPPRPAAATRHPGLLHAAAHRRAAPPARRTRPAGSDPVRGPLRPQHRPHAAVPARHARRQHQGQGGDPAMKLDALIYINPMDFLPWIIAVGILFPIIIAAMLYDDGVAATRRRANRNRTLGLAQRATRDARYATGRSTLATATAVIPTFPATFMPEPLEPGQDSPLTGPGEVETGSEPDPVVEEPTPAPQTTRVWPVPQLLPQPQPGPVEAVLFHATGAYPTYPEFVDHTGMTGVLPRYEDYMSEPAGAR